MNDTQITIIGNVVEDPTLRFTPSGAAVANFRIASTPRHFDKQANEWRDGEAMFLSVSAWRQMAENVAETLRRGMRVVVVGNLKARSYEDRDGNKRTVFEIEADEVGPSLKFATASVDRGNRTGGQPAQSSQPAAFQSGGGWPAPPAGDEPPF